jgi:hypothetical protein
MILHDVPIPTELANTLTTPQALANWGRTPMRLRLGDHDLGLWTIDSLDAQWDSHTRNMVCRVELRQVEP